MHILIAVLHRPDKPAGVCRHAANLARCLAEIDEVTQITLVTGVWQQHYFKTVFLLDSPKINILGVDIKNTAISRNFWFLFGLPTLVKKIQPDLVHLSFPFPFIRSLFACPVVATIHDLYPCQLPEQFGRIPAFFNRLFLQQCIHSSDALTCVSQTTLHDLEYYFPEVGSEQKKTTVIYNFVDFDRIEPTIPKILEEIADCPFILCVGQHRKNKNLDLLIQAYALLKQDHRFAEGTKSILVGSIGPETATLVESIRELDLEDSILMLSEIDDNQLCWLYQNCQLVVIPSAVEGFCIPLVEALYFSAQVVCSDIPILREIGSSNCTYFELAGDPIGNMARSIVSVAAPRENRSQQADTDSCLRFTKATIAAQFLKLYAALI